MDLHDAGHFLGSLAGAALGGFLRGSRHDPRVKAITDWLKRQVHRLAAHQEVELEPEPLIDQLDPVTLPPLNRRKDD